jgi:uncharacterized protein (DUF305 family)
MKPGTHVHTVTKLLTTAILLGAVVLTGPALAQRMGPGSGPRSGGPGGMGPGTMRIQTTSEASFLAHMIPHHQEAIDSARQLLNVTERPELIDLARGIIETQSDEIEAMAAWLDAWHPEVEREVAYEPMMRDLRGAAASEIERAFLEDMIVHHMVAVREARMLLARGYAEHEEVAELARTIIATQTSEMRQMASWLSEWFGVRGPMGGGPGRMMGF